MAFVWNSGISKGRSACTNDSMMIHVHSMNARSWMVDEQLITPPFPPSPCPGCDVVFAGGYRHLGRRVHVRLSGGDDALLPWNHSAQVQKTFAP